MVLAGVKMMVSGQSLIGPQGGSLHGPLEPRRDVRTPSDLSKMLPGHNRRGKPRFSEISREDGEKIRGDETGR